MILLNKKGYRMRAIRLTLGLTLSTLALLSAGCPRPLPPADATEVRLQAVATGLTAPLAVVHANDNSGRLFIADQIGTVRIVDGAGLRGAAFLDIRDWMVTLNPGYDERGLLGIAFHPEYASNGRFFVYYNPSGEARTRLSEFRVSGDPNAADPSSERVILEIVKPQNNHNGGQLAFGPDGMLYIGVGDGGGANDQGTGHTPNLGNGQDRTTLLGKILRIDVDSATPYGIPADNPFVGQGGGIREEIYAYGLRNPWRFSFDTAQGGSRLFVADVGQDAWEEVSIVRKGDNLGWYIREGAHCFDPDDIAGEACDTGVDGSTLVDPILEYPHAPSVERPIAGVSVTGGFVYRGTDIPGLRGKFVFADWSAGFVSAQGKLLVAEEQSDGTWTLEELAVAGRDSRRIDRYILSLGRDEKNELYVCTSQNPGPSGQTGAVYRMLTAE
jgi:glucose/arabinose dehydrogenase